LIQSCPSALRALVQLAAQTPAELR
jgi:hypothetical protein